MNRNTDGWIAVSEGPTGVWLFVGEENAVPADLPTYPDAGTGSIALHNGSNEVYLYHEEGGWKEFKLGGVSPEGTLLIVANGAYDVRDKASVSVNVQAVSNEDALIEGTISGEYVNGTATKVRSDCFKGYRSFTRVEMNAVETIENNGFINCSNLVEAVFKNVLTVGGSAFQGCSNLKTVNIEKATEIKSYAFNYLKNLETVNMDGLITVGNDAFSSCSKLKSVYLPSVRTIDTSAFYACSALTRVEICGACVGTPLPVLSAQCFYSSKLDTLIIAYEDGVVSLASTTAIGETPIANGTGFIYVPDALVDSYKAATNWSTYAAQIKGLSELPA